MKPALDIQSLLSAYRSGLTDPREVVHVLQKRMITVNNPAIWTYRLSLEELEPYLANLELMDPKDLPLYGIPFAIKDNIDLKAIPTTAACKAYAYTPRASSFVVEKLIRAGAIPLGKTNLDQFATGLVGVRTPYGIPRNPIAPDRVPGGSSCGSAVALSEHLVSFSLGTDTAGSGRVPALFNKLWGVKPSRGRLSTTGVVPACRTLDCVSVFAHNAVDGETVMKVVEGYDSEDAYSQPVKDISLRRSNKIGVPKPEQLLFFGDAHYQSAWECALEVLQAKGWELVEVDFEPFLQAARLLYEGPWVAERTTALKDFLECHAEDLFPVTRQIIEGGLKNTACEAFGAAYKLAALKRQSESVWDDIAALVTPTAGGFPTLEEVASDPLGPNSQLGYYTNFMNLLDLCAVAAPAGETETGLPFGVTWIGPRDSDLALLKAAASGPCLVSNVPDDDEKQTVSSISTGSTGSGDTLSVLLFGAHMSGLPLNKQVLELGGDFIAEVRTAPIYRMIYLREPSPHRPGIIRIGKGGASIVAEEWRFPKTSLGRFLATIQQPLGLGQIELRDGRRVHGFLCEAAAEEGAMDISRYGGWRSFLESVEAD